MPTGFTADVVSGEITTLRQFALRCARGMGATIMMRDEPWDAPIPERFEPSTSYHEENLAKAKETLAEIERLSSEDCNARAEQDYADRLASHQKYEDERGAENDRLKSMLEKVSAWHTEAEGIKEFMSDQLRISMSDYVSPPPQKMTGEEWLTATRREALRSISYHEKNIADEIHRTEMRNQWLADLRRSLEGVDDVG
ncbi:hypothetical protein ACK9YZ_01165 [Rhizobium sp. ZK1]|uniref:hypothetical protein n=1 Tax=Rhizobium sp. ZK1 TaxID=3389872 RepID=UPI0039F7122D